MNLTGINTGFNYSALQFADRRRDLSLIANGNNGASVDLAANRPPCQGGDAHVNLSNDGGKPSLSVESNRPSRREFISALQANFGF